MAKEHTLWTWLRKAKRELGQELDMERVENSCANGTPDVDGQYINPWKIELKRCERLKTVDRVVIRWQPSQKFWLKRRWDAGANVWALIAVGEGPTVKRYLIRGCDVEGLNVTSEAELEELSVIDPKASASDVIRAAAGLSFG